MSTVTLNPNQVNHLRGAVFQNYWNDLPSDLDAVYQNPHIQEAARQVGFTTPSPAYTAHLRAAILEAAPGIQSHPIHMSVTIDGRQEETIIDLPLGCTIEPGFKEDYGMDRYEAVEGDSTKLRITVTPGIIGEGAGFVCLGFNNRRQFTVTKNGQPKPLHIDIECSNLPDPRTLS